MPRVHLHDLWTNTCRLLLVGVAYALCWSVINATKCEKCEKEGEAYVLLWNSSRMLACFRTAHNARIWSFFKTATRFICFARRCCSLSYSLFSTRTSQHYGCFYALSSLLFARQAASSVLHAPITIFGLFWCCDNETASAATALRMINLCKFTQIFCKQGILIAFLSGTDVCAQVSIPEAWQIAFLKPDRSQSHTPPTENTHCKISSLALRRLATILLQSDSINWEHDCTIEVTRGESNSFWRVSNKGFAVDQFPAQQGQHLSGI